MTWECLYGLQHQCCSICWLFIFGWTSLLSKLAWVHHKQVGLFSLVKIILFLITDCSHGAGLNCDFVMEHFLEIIYAQTRWQDPSWFLKSKVQLLGHKVTSNFDGRSTCLLRIEFPRIHSKGIFIEVLKWWRVKHLSRDQDVRISYLIFTTTMDWWLFSITGEIIW